MAREYGIPAVMGTGDGTRRILDGAEVRVDGARGVIIAAPAAPAGTRPMAGVNTKVVQRDIVR